MKVLILEHDPVCAFDYLAALELAGFEVLGPVPRVADAEMLARLHRPQLALIDLHLGRESGLEVVPALRLLGVRCYAVTGYPLEACAAADMLDGCLPKPAAGEQVVELAQYVAAFLAGRPGHPPSTLLRFTPGPPDVPPKPQRPRPTAQACRPSGSR